MIEFKEFDESWKSRNRFEMTPMIDMIFLLLIFFLLTSSISNPVLSVDLSETETAEAAADQEIIITVDENRKIFIDGGRISQDKLQQQLFNEISETGAEAVYIEADESLDFGFIVEIMDICNRAGAPEISFIVEEKKDAE